MNPLTIFLLIFLAFCFFMIIVQHDLSGRQKFFLMLNPAILVLILSIQLTCLHENQECATALAPAARAVSTLLHQGGSNGKKAAEILRTFLAKEKNPDWEKLSESLSRIAETPGNSPGKTRGETPEQQSPSPDLSGGNGEVLPNPEKSTGKT